MVTVSIAGCPLYSSWTKHQKKTAAALSRHALRGVGVPATDVRMHGRIVLTLRRMCTAAERSTVTEPFCAAEYRLR